MNVRRMLQPQTHLTAVGVYVFDLEMTIADEWSAVTVGTLTPDQVREGLSILSDGRGCTVLEVQVSTPDTASVTLWYRHQRNITEEVFEKTDTIYVKYTRV